MNRDIFICIKDTKAEADLRKVIQPVLIEKGDIVQFRFESERNFRTINEEYFKVSIDIWKECFAKIGSIWDKVQFNNKATMKEILNLQLFDQTEEQRMLQNKIISEIE